MYRLYGTNLTGTCAVQAALAELDVPFERIEVSTKEGQHLTEDYKKINPRQQVPALVLPDGLVVTEGPAILNHLADAHPEAPVNDPIAPDADHSLALASSTWSRTSAPARRSSGPVYSAAL